MSFHPFSKDLKDVPTNQIEKQLQELITPKVLVALIAVIIGIYLVKKANKINIVSQKI